MEKTRIIWGVIWLSLAALLEILNLTQSLTFYVADHNMGWVPIVALAIVGIILL